MLQGLVRAYLDKYNAIELETDNVGAFWEWSDSMINGVPGDHEFYVRQLNTRKRDNNRVLVSRPIDENSNELERYLARYSAGNYDKILGKVWCWKLRYDGCVCWN